MGIKSEPIIKNISVDNKTIDTNPKGEIEVLKNNIGIIGEIRMFHLSINNSINHNELINNGWAVCDGTTPSSQGISNPIIITTPNLKSSFIRMSSNLNSGQTGGTTSHKHTLPVGREGYYGTAITPNSSPYGTSGSSFSGHTFSASGQSASAHYLYSESVDNIPPFFELVFYMKVK